MLTRKWPAWLMMAGLSLAVMAAAPPHQEATPATEATTEATPAGPPVWISPTPDATGAIVVVVQPGESLWVIAARAGLTLPDLLALNNLTEQSIINPGDAIIIGYGTPETVVTPEVVIVPEEATPTVTLPPPTPRPTEPRPVAAVCLSAFDDLNRNGIHEAAEPLRAGVAFTVYNTDAVVANYITDGRSEPRCLGGLSPGEYRVTRSVAPGEILTSGGDWSLSLSAGSELYQAFGSVTGEGAAGPTPAAGLTSTPAAEAVAQAAGTPVPQSPDGDGTERSIRMAGVAVLFLGGLLLLGAVLILLFRQSRNRPATRPPDSADGERRFQKIDDLE